jgi:hypothetical protein
MKISHSALSRPARGLGKACRFYGGAVEIEDGSGNRLEQETGKKRME